MCCWLIGGGGTVPSACRLALGAAAKVSARDSTGRTDCGEEGDGKSRALHVCLVEGNTVVRLAMAGGAEEILNRNFLLK